MKLHPMIATTHPGANFANLSSEFVATPAFVLITPKSTGMSRHTTIEVLGRSLAERRKPAAKTLDVSKTMNVWKVASNIKAKGNKSVFD